MNNSFSPFPKKILVVALSTALTMGISPNVNAESPIAMDKTTGSGTGADQNFQTAGANQTLIIQGGGENANGTVKGSNLFFSFNKFGVAQGDTAHFQCAGDQCGTGSATTNQANVKNVISRVTGGNPSEINGTLKSTVGNADVWFFNPKGVAVGAGAQIDVPAALHISTANQLKDTDNKTMWTGDVNDSTLTTANPQSFGFDPASTGDIKITGSTISVGNGESEIASANDVAIINSQIPTQKTNTSGTLKISAQGKITVDATSRLKANLMAGTDINNNGIINGDAEATTDTLINTHTIGGNAVAGTDLINDVSGTIGKNATAKKGALTNRGVIGFDPPPTGTTFTATAGTKLDNSGTIHGNAVIERTNPKDTIVNGDFNSALINTGSIAGDATVKITNKGTITGSTAATLSENNSIKPSKHAIVDIINEGNINVDVTATMSGTGTANITNSTTGIIEGNAKASTYIVNNGIINGDAEASTGILTNSNVIKGNAVAGKDIINNIGGTIDNGAIAGNDIINNAVINGGIIQAQHDIKNTGNTAHITLNKAGSEINAGHDLLIDEDGKITVNNTDNTIISAVNNLTLGSNKGAGLIEKTGTGDGNFEIKTTGTTGTFTLNNTASKIIDQSAGSGDMNVIVANGNLILENGNSIEKIAGTGNLSVDVKAGDIEVGTDLQIAAKSAYLAKEIKVTGDINNSGSLTANTVRAGKQLINNSGATITGNANSKELLNNAGSIAGNAKATTNIENDGMINGDAEASTGILTNNNTIEGNAVAGTDLINDVSGIIGKNATAGGTLDNKGIITGTATANGDATVTPRLINTGVIKIDAIATKGALTNTHSIDGNAVAGTDLINDVSGIIGKNATANTKLDNSGAIKGNATTEHINPEGIFNGNFNSSPLVNNGIIKGNAAVNIINYGTINDSVIADISDISGNGTIEGRKTASITNLGTIGKNATASTKLDNSGNIHGNAVIEQTNPKDTKIDGDFNSELINTGSITGDASVNITNKGIITGSTTAIISQEHAIKSSKSATVIIINEGEITGDATATILRTGTANITNSTTGIIEGNAKASTDIENSGFITGDAEAGTDIINNIIGTIAKNATAGRSLDNKGTINGDAIASTGTLTNSKLIGGNATGASLNNSGVITKTATANGDATVIPRLINTGTINSDAIATMGALTNSYIIGNNAEAGTDIINNIIGTIAKNATAGRSLDNKGTINGDAIASTGTLTNSKLIGGNATGASLNNSGVITKTATANGDATVIPRLINTGTIKGDAIATTGTLSNYHLIIGNAIAGNKLDNNGGTIEKNALVTNGQLINQASSIIKGKATAKTDINNYGIIRGDTEAITGTLANYNSIEGNAEAGTDIINNIIGTLGKNATAGKTVNNEGIITGTAQANGDATVTPRLVNMGTIRGDAIATIGALANYNLIVGNAIAGSDIINNIGGTLSNGATAGNDLINYAVINGETVHAERDLINTGTSAEINLNKVSGEVSAKRDLLVNDGGRIIFSNTGTALAMASGIFTISNMSSITALNLGEFYTLAGGDLNVNTAGKLTANNKGEYAATIGAGTMFDSAGQLSATQTGGSLFVQQGGIIEKNTGSGDLTITAHASREEGFSPDKLSSGGQLVVEGSGSTIRVGISHFGNLIIYPDGLVATKYIGHNNQFSDATNKEQYAFRVSDGGVINKNNWGDMKITAQTVYLGGLNAIVGWTNGAMNFNSVIESDALNDTRLPRYFKMQDATMTNIGPISISDYFLNLDPSGIKSDTSITLNIFNSADIVYPKVLIGRGSSITGLKTSKNFLDAPSNSKILINNRISLNPEDNIGTLTRDISAAMMVSSNIIPELPDNPCDSHNQSTLNFKGVANYIPDVSSQVPYSLLTTATGRTVALASAEKIPSLTLDESLECQ